MKIADLIQPNLIKLELESKKKTDIITEIVEMMVNSGALNESKPFLQSVMERESLGTTGIGKGIAIPHGKSDTVARVTVAFARSTKGVDFESLDSKPVHLVFMLAAPLEANNEYLQALTKLSRFLRQESFRNSLMAAKSPEEVIDLLVKEE